MPQLMTLRSTLERATVREQPLIMAVDDDREMLGLLKDLLGLEGFDFVGACDGQMALAMLDENSPDLILLDIVMRDFSGFEALPEFRAHTAVPIIMLTARCEPAVLKRALEMGADDYVTKPFSAPELLARIRAKLRRAAAAVA